MASHGEAVDDRYRDHPGLQAGNLQSVNHFGLDTGQVYAPPQAGLFTLVESLASYGAEPDGPLLLHTPSNPGNPGPARDLVCPGGAAK